MIQPLAHFRNVGAAPILEEKGREGMTAPIREAAGLEEHEVGRLAGAILDETEQARAESRIAEGGEEVIVSRGGSHGTEPASRRQGVRGGGGYVG
jgi:hypothetical protein